MTCSFIAKGNEPCPFGCKKGWIMCHYFLEDSCRHDQWEYCGKGWHISEENYNAKYDPRNKAKYSSQASRERCTNRRSRSRGTDGKNKRGCADSPSREASTRIAQEAGWQVTADMQIALQTLHITSFVLPTEASANEAFKLAMNIAQNDVERERVSRAFATVRRAITKQSEATSSSKQPSSSSR